MRGSNETLRQLKEEDNRVADMSDWASYETERNFQLRARDRERKLLSKIDEALRRIEEGTYGYCEETQEPIAEDASRRDRSRRQHRSSGTAPTP